MSDELETDNELESVEQETIQPEFTEDDEKDGVEFRELRKANRLINEELSKHSWKIKREFEKLFPCKNRNITIEVGNKEYVMEQRMISVHIKVDKIRGDDPKEYKAKYSMETISFESHDDFWKKWKKFRKFHNMMF